jgi:signal transduction histidine kinase
VTAPSVDLGLSGLGVSRILSAIFGIGERTRTPMTETAGDSSMQEARHEPQVLANIPSTIAQRHTALIFVLSLIAIFAGTWPFKDVKLWEIEAFLPSVAAALSVADGVAAALLFAQFSILRQWALLIIASGYSFSALMVFAHALSFPGVFAPHGFLVVGTGLQSAIWIYWIWHGALILSIIGYALLKDSDHEIGVRSARLAISLSIVAVVAVAVGFYWFATVHEDLLPITFADVRPLSLFRHLVGGITLLVMGGIGLCLLWLRRRSLLDQWLMVALCAFLLEVAIVSTFAARYTVGWYAGRFYQVITATVVMVVLLAEMTKLYVLLARTNMVLQYERDNKLKTLEAMAASISHEVRQPLAAIATRGGTSLRILEHAPLDLGKVRSNLSTIVSESHRASQIFDNIRALFNNADSAQHAIDINEIALGALRVLRDDLEEHGIATRIELASELPPIMGHGGQMQEVVLNLIHNAIEAMDTVKDGYRILLVRTEHHGRDAIALAIKDSGPGIDPERLGSIFDPFVTTKPRGMGLGLAICRMTIERHGGQLLASSDKDKGAQFQFILPINSALGATGAPLSN